MKRLPRTHGRHGGAERRPAGDPFDRWLELVVELIIEPLFDLLRFAWRMIRDHWPRSRPGRRKRSPRNGRRRHRDGGET